MRARLGLAVALSAALHAAVAAMLVALPPAAIEEPPEQGVAITVVFSAGGGGERIGEATADPVPPVPLTAAAPPAEAAPEPAAAEPAPPEPAEPQVETAALPLPAPPPPAAPSPPPAPALPARATPPAPPQDAGSEAAAALLTAAIPASVGRKVDPVVPREARQNRWQGTVVLAVTVSPEGVPALVEVLRSSGRSLLDRAAIEAMWQWRFDPARRGGVPVEERIAIPITFRIVD